MFHEYIPNWTRPWIPRNVLDSSNHFGSILVSHEPLGTMPYPSENSQCFATMLQKPRMTNFWYFLARVLPMGPVPRAPLSAVCIESMRMHLVLNITELAGYINDPPPPPPPPQASMSNSINYQRNKYNSSTIRYLISVNDRGLTNDKHNTRHTQHCHRISCHCERMLSTLMTPCAENRGSSVGQSDKCNVLVCLAWKPDLTRDRLCKLESLQPTWICHAASLTLCKGNPPVTDEFLHKGSVLQKACPCYNMIISLPITELEIFPNIWQHFSKQLHVSC